MDGFSTTSMMRRAILASNFCGAAVEEIEIVSTAKISAKSVV